PREATKCTTPDLRKSSLITSSRGSLPSLDKTELTGITLGMMYYYLQSRQETHISQQRGSGTYEGTGSRPRVPDVPSDDSKEELSWNSSDDEDVGGQDEGDKNDEKGSFDPIPRTPEGSEEESDDEADQKLRLSEEARIQEEEEADELYFDVNINQGRGLQVT
nr:hypothetical protein [Tanacetum cinerariifolium]